MALLNKSKYLQNLSIHYFGFSDNGYFYLFMKGDSERETSSLTAQSLWETKELLTSPYLVFCDLFLIGDRVGRRGWSTVKQVNCHGIRGAGCIKDKEWAEFVTVSEDHMTFFNTDGFVVSQSEKMFLRYPK